MSGENKYTETTADMDNQHTVYVMDSVHLLYLGLASGLRPPCFQMLLALPWQLKPLLIALIFVLAHTKIILDCLGKNTGRRKMRGCLGLSPLWSVIVILGFSCYPEPPCDSGWVLVVESDLF